MGVFISYELSTVDSKYGSFRISYELSTVDSKNGSLLRYLYTENGKNEIFVGYQRNVFQGVSSDYQHRFQLTQISDQS